MIDHLISEPGASRATSIPPHFVQVSHHVGPLLQAAPAVAALITAFWRDRRVTVALHRAGAGRAASLPAGS